MNAAEREQRERARLERTRRAKVAAAERRLAKLGTERARAEQRFARAVEALRTAMREEAEAGTLSKVRMAEVAGVSRQSVYDAINEEENA